jgi:hypothetical protein
MKYIIIPILSILFIAGCTDVIDVETEFDDEKLVVDAWLDNLSRLQTIRLTYSQPYFENDFAQGVGFADVYLLKNGVEKIQFLSQGDGNFIWTPGIGESLGTIGDKFELNISFENSIFSASTEIFRVPEIDSIAQIYEEGQIGTPEGIYAELIVDDLPGLGDTYWVKTWKNGQYLNKPLELVLVYDGTFDSGSGLDGGTFIFPLRRGVNPIADDVEEGEEVPPPYIAGDSIYVELLSISNQAHRFLQIAFEQMTNGDNGIFALPVANTKSNIIGSNGQEALGFFNVAAVESASTTIR